MREARDRAGEPAANTMIWDRLPIPSREASFPCTKNSTLPRPLADSKAGCASRCDGVGSCHTVPRRRDDRRGWDRREGSTKFSSSSHSSSHGKSLFFEGLHIASCRVPSFPVPSLSLSLLGTQDRLPGREEHASPSCSLLPPPRPSKHAHAHTHTLSGASCRLTATANDCRGRAEKGGRETDLFQQPS